MKTLIKRRDFIIAVFMLAFSALLLAEILSIRVPESRALPMVSLALCFLSGIAVLIGSRKDNTEAKKLLIARREWIVIITLLACWALMEYLGFYTSVFLMLFAVELTLAKDLSVKTIFKKLEDFGVFEKLPDDNQMTLDLEF